MEGSLKDTPYETRIRRLMTGEDGDQYGFYINITDNIVREVKNTGCKNRFIPIFWMMRKKRNFAEHF